MKKRTKKLLPFILIPTALLIGTWVYLETSNTEVSLLANTFNPGGEEDQQAEPQEIKVEFKNYGSAPELVGITQWLNGGPQTISNLKGKVVLVNFWSYSGINSVKTFPFTKDWYQKYKDKGLEIIGVHTPEFAFGKVPGNVENAVKAHGLTYPIALDSNYKTWGAYQNQFWPAYYLVDKNGNIVYTHFGEGNYEAIEKALRILLGLEGEYSTPPAAPEDQAITPDFYLGTVRLDRFGNTEKPSTNEQIYTFPKKLAVNKFAIEGRWQFTQEAAVHTAGFARLKFNFNAAKVFIVAQASKPVTIRVYVDGELIKGVVVSNSDLYQLYNSLSGGEHSMEIEIPTGSLEIFSFTFG